MLPHVRDLFDTYLYPHVKSYRDQAVEEATKFALSYGWKWMTQKTTVSVTLMENEYLYGQIGNWVSTKANLTLTHLDNVGLVPEGTEADPWEDTPSGHNPLKKQQEANRVVAGNPAIGLYLIWHDNTPILLQYGSDFQRATNGMVTGMRRYLKLWSYRGQFPGLTSFLRMVSNSYVKNEVRTVTVSVSSSAGYWERLNAIGRRPMDSVVLPSDQKERVIADIRQFFQDEDWYYDNAVPFRRGYLFHGLPGTGKSSFILALASLFDMPLYILNLADPDLDDSKLQELFNSVGNNVIVLLEDIDTVIEGRSIGGEKRKLSFSAVLNAIDGVTASQDRILFMTTNHIDALDPALIRPGRVDYRMEFSTLTPEQAGTMITRFYPELIETLPTLLAHPKITQMVAAELQKLLIDVRPDPLSLLTALDDYTVVRHK